MGLLNFRKFISKNNNPIHKISFDELSINTVCIDIAIFIYKFITSIRKTGKDLEHNGKITSHIVGLRNQINLFEKLHIIPIYVFDGKPPKEKNKILSHRLNIKQKAELNYQKTKNIASFQQSFYITEQIIDSAKEYLQLRGIRYIHQENMEADFICAQLVKQKIADCAYSTDFDILVYGAKYLIININYQKKYLEYIVLSQILRELDLTYDEFVDVIVLSGCDYCDKQDNLTLNKAYTIVKNNNYKLSNMNERAKQIFMHNIKIHKSWIKTHRKNSKKLILFLRNNGFANFDE